MLYILYCTYVDKTTYRFQYFRPSYRYTTCNISYYFHNDNNIRAYIYYNNIYDSRRCGVNAFQAPRVRVGVLQSVVVYYYYIYIYWNIHPPIHPPIWPVLVFGVERLNVLLKQSLRCCLRKIWLYSYTSL